MKMTLAEIASFLAVLSLARMIRLSAILGPLRKQMKVTSPLLPIRSIFKN